MKYGFWIWSHKLTGVLHMLAEFSKYELSEIEIETIQQGLIGTNDELNKWTIFRLEGQKFNIEINLAYDAEEKSDIIHLRIVTTSELREKLDVLNLFQSMFKDLKLEN